MTWQVGWLSLVGLLLVASSVWSQAVPGPSRPGPAGSPQYAPQYTPPAGRPAQAQPIRPDQPVIPRDPRLARLPAPRAASPAPMRQAPFRLTPEHEAYLDKVLVAWEQQGSKVTTFETSFPRAAMRTTSPRKRSP